MGGGQGVGQGKGGGKKTWGWLRGEAMDSEHRGLSSSSQLWQSRAMSKIP